MQTFVKTGDIIENGSFGKTRNLINILLAHYRQKEKDTEGDIMFFSHNEMDGNNTTKFESLANARMIGIQSKLPREDVNIIMKIFFAIIDNNYWRFDPEELADIIDRDVSDTDKTLLKQYDIATWIKCLQMDDEEGEVEDDMPDLDSSCLHDKLKGVYKQKYYTVDEIDFDMILEKKQKKSSK